MSASERAVFAMQITHALTLDKYFEGPQYACKRPVPDNFRGNNIYRRGPPEDLCRCVIPPTAKAPLKKISAPIGS